MAMAMGVRIKSQSRMGINPQVCRPAFHSMLDNRPAGMEIPIPSHARPYRGRHGTRSSSFTIRNEMTALAMSPPRAASSRHLATWR